MSRLSSILFFVFSLIILYGCQNDEPLEGVEVTDVSIISIDENLFIPVIYMENKRKEIARFHMKIEFNNENISEYLEDINIGEYMFMEDGILELEPSPEYYFSITMELPDDFPKELNEELNDFQVIVYNQEGYSKVYEFNND